MSDTLIAIPASYEEDLISFFWESRGAFGKNGHAFTLEEWMKGSDQGDLLPEHFAMFLWQVDNGQRCIYCLSIQLETPDMCENCAHDAAHVAPDWSEA